MMMTALDDLDKIFRDIHKQPKEHLDRLDRRLSICHQLLRKISFHQKDQFSEKAPAEL